jgi:hypothetical protein
MTVRKARNVAGSHRAKLLALARNRGEDFQFLLGRWVVERFLFRLAGSSQKDNFILKGATLFLAWEGQLHRPTKDLDLMGFGSPDVAEATHRIRDVCAVPVADGIVFDLAGVHGERIKEDAEYEGVRVRVPASLDGARISMRIDIGFGTSQKKRNRPRGIPYWRPDGFNGQTTAHGCVPSVKSITWRGRLVTRETTCRMAF